MISSSPPSRRRAIASIALVFASQLFEATSEILRKLGADASSSITWLPQWTGLATLGSPWTWAAILAALAAFGLWLVALKHLDLGVAFIFGSVVHLFVALGSWLVLGERFSLARSIGIAFIVAGLVVVARSQAVLEKRVESSAP